MWDCCLEGMDKKGESTVGNLRTVKLFAIVIAIVGGLGFVPVQAQQVDMPSVVFQVVVVYDPNGDGTPEGVGPGVVVNAREPSSDQGAIQITDHFSSVFFTLHPGLHRITAFPKSTRFLFEWVCAETVFVSEENDKIKLECEERFFLRFPWAMN